LWNFIFRKYTWENYYIWYFFHLFYFQFYLFI